MRIHLSWRTVSIAVTLLAPSLDALESYGVCPFTNISNQRNFDWLSDGMGETLSNDMKLANMVVVERLHLKEVLKNLELGQSGILDEKSAAKPGLLVGAKYLITGSFQINKKEIRLIAKVIEAENGVVRRSAKITGDVDSLFSLQDALFFRLFGEGEQKQKINNEIENEIRKHPTTNQKAYAWYLLQLDAIYRAANRDDPNSRGNSLKAVEFGEKAVAEDPRFTPAWISLSYAYYNLQNREKMAATVAKAVASVGPDTSVLVKNEALALPQYLIAGNFERAVYHYKEMLKYNESNIAALWQLWAIYRGAFGSNLHDVKQSNVYGAQLLRFHEKSVLAQYVREYSKSDRLQ